MKIDLAKFGGSDFNPSDVLASQSDSWSQYWAPKDVEGDKIKSACYECMAIFRAYAQPLAKTFKFGVSEFRKGIKG